MRSFLHHTFHNPSSRSFVVVNDILAATTLISVLVVVLETVPSFEKYSHIFLAIEYVAVGVFTLEYIARFSVAKKSWRYVTSFYGVIDIVSIVPTYLGLTNLTFLKSARILRIMRFLRMVRLTKIARMQRTDFDIEDHQNLYRLNITLYFFALFFSVLVLGTFMYLVEGNTTEYESIPLGMLWALERILGGGINSFPLPQTSLGEFVSLATRFIGLVLLGVLITVVGSMVRKLIFGSDDKQLGRT